METYDFGGYVTRYNILCDDGRKILPGAFADQDGKTVSLVYNHDHNTLTNVLGDIKLVNRPDGVYGLGKFDDTEVGKLAKQMVHSGSLRNLSIFANNLLQNKATGEVRKGRIREVSLVLAGANPGAYIDDIMSHNAEDGECAYIYDTDNEIEFGDAFNAEYLDILAHASAGNDTKEETKMAEPKAQENSNSKSGQKTIMQIFDTLNEEQKEAVYALMAMIIEDGDGDNDKEEGDDNVKHSVFNDGEGYTGNAMQMPEEVRHSAIEEVLSFANMKGNLRDGFNTFLKQSAIPGPYGITSIEELFPDTKWVNGPLPEIIDDNEWVPAFLDNTSNFPGSKFGSMFADLSGEEARAMGYITGDYKKEEVFTWLRRETGSQTIVKAQAADRDVIIDLGDNIDIAAYYAKEMRMMWRLEAARGMLIGDGRASSDRHKIKPDKIRPIATDGDFFAPKISVQPAQGEKKAAVFIDKVIGSMSKYKGNRSGAIMFIKQDLLDDLRVLKDGDGHYMYKSDDELAKALRVTKVVPTQCLDLFSYNGVGLLGILVNPHDYTVARPPKGKETMLNDFNIDYNQYKWVYEGRLGGALLKPATALVFYDGAAPEIDDTTSGVWRSAAVEREEDPENP